MQMDQLHHQKRNFNSTAGLGHNSARAGMGQLLGGDVADQSEYRPRKASLSGQQR